MAQLASVTEFAQGSVRGFLHTPADSPTAGLVITHGAGGNCEGPLLVAVANAFSEAGFLVLRCDLPFRQQKPFGPPSPATAPENRAGLKDAITAVGALGCRQVFLGGHSYGGRQASILAAEEPELADSLLLLSYPLHPPYKPKQLRTDHLPSLRVPALFVHGTQDQFGSIDNMRAAIQVIPARKELVVIEGAGHDLARGAFDVDQLVVNQLLSLMR
ncbi:MAG: alpha/beta fold hydrolase [Bryobacteraceae bacterium]|jgi:predicted alpha/beta-hydrolase family hydrolase